MIFKNSRNLPPHIVRVLEAAYLNSGYDGPDGSATRTISVSRLVGPAQKLVLERAHEKELEIDVMDTVHSVMGQAVHYVLERAGKSAPELVPERRLTVEHDGWTISGKTDLYETEEHILTDWKTSSVWAFVFGKEEWNAQLNVYRWLSERNGHPVKGLEVILFCKDWRRGESRKNPDYPDPIVRMPIPLWSMDETTAYIDGRLKAHRMALNGTPEPCTAEERWARPDTYAVMKPGSKRALRVFEDMNEALEKAQMAGADVEKRPGESVRCSGYCAASPYCPTWAADPTNPKNAPKEDAA